MASDFNSVGLSPLHSDYIKMIKDNIFKYNRSPEMAQIRFDTWKGQMGDRVNEDYANRWNAENDRLNSGATGATGTGGTQFNNNGIVTPGKPMVPSGTGGIKPLVNNTNPIASSTSNVRPNSLTGGIESPISPSNIGARPSIATNFNTGSNINPAGVTNFNSGISPSGVTNFNSGSNIGTSKSIYNRPNQMLSAKRRLGMGRVV